MNCLSFYDVICYWFRKESPVNKTNNYAICIKYRYKFKRFLTKLEQILFNKKKSL